MKRFVILLIAVFTAGTLYSQDHEGPYIAFDRELHDYGEISTEEVPEGKIYFTIYNQGSQPLVLSNVRACCGTRVNDYTNEPIASSDSGYVEVEFRIVPRHHKLSYFRIPGYSAHICRTGRHAPSAGNRRYLNGLRTAGPFRPSTKT